jgi:hypothetical protein
MAKGPHLAIENIEEMRRREGIDDAELLQDIHGLHVGDSVHLTLLTGKAWSAGETVLVRITQIKGNAFRGKLVHSPASTDLSNVEAGSCVAFTTAHIHSLAKGR